MRKSLALRISGPILLVVSIVFIVTTYLNYKNMVNTQLQQEQKQYNLISQNIINDMSTVFDKARLGLSSVVENPAIQKAFADRDREELLQLTMPIFKTANAEGIDQFQFHLAPAVSFLRLHQPEKYGDDLSSFRFTVLECNKTQKTVAGLEEGKGGFGFRVVMPIFYEGKHIGSVEYGPGLNDTLVKQWQQQMGGEYYIYATAQSGVAWENKEEGLLVSTLKDDPYKVEGNDIKNTLTSTSAKTVYIDEKQKVALLIPLKDYTGKAVGYVKVIQDRLGVLNNLNTILVSSIIRVLLALLIVLATTIYISRSITKPLVQLSEAAEVVAQGDLTKEIDIFTSKDEIGVLTSAFKRMIFNLKSLLAEIQNSTESLSSYSQQLAASNEEVSASMEEIASTTDKVANTSAESSQVAQTAIADSEKVQRVAQEGNQAVNQTVEKIHYIASATSNVSEAIQKLSEHSTQIGEIINVISEIAEQTNLLSLNAAIEAARAGEHGRGFAVVADEVGKLAEQSARAAKDITGLIKEIQSGIGEAKGAIDKGNQEVNEGTQIAGYAGSSLEEIITAVSKNTLLIKDLANGFNKSNEGTLELTNSYQQIAATMQEVAAAAQELANIANQLQTNVIKFKI